MSIISYKLKCCNSKSKHKEDGIVPVKEFPYIFNCLEFVKNPRLEGIVPVKKLVNNSIPDSCDKSPMDEGIDFETS